MRSLNQLILLAYPLAAAANGLARFRNLTVSTSITPTTSFLQGPSFLSQSSSTSSPREHIPPSVSVVLSIAPSVQTASSRNSLTDTYSSTSSVSSSSSRLVSVGTNFNITTSVINRSESNDQTSRRTSLQYNATATLRLSRALDLPNSTAAAFPMSTQSAGPLATLLGAIGQLASNSEGDSVPATAATTNALSILLSALPSNVVSNIESEIEHKSHQIFGSSTSDVQQVFSTTGSAFTSMTAPTPTSSDGSSVSHIPSTLSTVISPPSSTIKPSQAGSTTVTAASRSGGSLAHASVAGIGSGIAAAAVVGLLGCAFLWRRRKQGKAPFHRSPSKKGRKRSSPRVFPESAWLYDPEMTPRDASGSPRERPGHGEDLSSVNLIPQPRDGVVEMSSAPSTPPMRPARPSSPLLGPEPIGLERAESPQRRRRSGSASPNRPRSTSQTPGRRKRARSLVGNSRTDLTRPMSAIYEEPYRPSIDGRQGLLTPLGRPPERHST